MDTSLAVCDFLEKLLFAMKDKFWILALLKLVLV